MIVADEQRDQSLGKLLAGVVDLAEADDVAIGGLCLDSRGISKGDCFVAIAGEHGHGTRYVREAVDKGAVAILSEDVEIVAKVGVPVVRVPALRDQLGIIAQRFFGANSADFKTIAVTGTNGKTSVCGLVAGALSKLDGGCGYIGTLGSGRWGELTATKNTTPDIFTTHRMISEFRGANLKTCALEASSHALFQERLAGIEIDIAAFTNLSHDHLDYHGSLSAYAAAKKRLFDRQLNHAVINMDDQIGEEILRELGDLKSDREDFRCPRIWRYSRNELSFSKYKEHASVDELICPQQVSVSLDGTRILCHTPVGQCEINSELVGSYNVDNLLAALGILLALGNSPSQATAALSNVAGIPGRLQRVAIAQPVGRDEHRQPMLPPHVFIDYAHSPDSLEKTLQTLTTLCVGNLICVFGCGGDRDLAKRPLMGRIASEYADEFIITNDNPRSEDPMDIARQILSGTTRNAPSRIELDRKLAIQHAILKARENDVVLIAGKGHEKYQIFKHTREPFSDLAIAKQTLEKIAERRLS